MTKVSRKATIFAKVESSYASDPTPAAADDAIAVMDWNPGPEQTSLERPEQGISIGNPQEVAGKAFHNVSFSAPVKGSGTAGTAPKGLTGLLQACALGVTNVPATSDTYAPVSATKKSCAIYGNIDGLSHKILGFVSNLEIDLQAGEIAKFLFSGQAPFVVPTDVTYPTTFTPNTTLPLVCKNMTVTLDSYAPKIAGIKINLNNKITEIPNLAATYGIYGFEVTDRNVTGEIVISAPSLAEKNYWSTIQANSTMILSIVLGATAGNIVTITCPAVKLQNISYDDNDGQLVHTIPFQCAKTGNGNNELSIAFT